jgi:hypothetical protein
MTTDVPSMAAGPLISALQADVLWSCFLANRVVTKMRLSC